VVVFRGGLRIGGDSLCETARGCDQSRTGNGRGVLETGLRRNELAEQLALHDARFPTLLRSANSEGIVTSAKRECSFALELRRQGLPRRSEAFLNR
jgi:hypothetical protein